MIDLIKKCANSAVWSLEKIVGRGHLARAARFFTNTVRLDYPNNLIENGETMVVECVAQAHTHSRPLVILDCGANVGEYSQMVQRIVSNRRVPTLSLHAFEPSLSTFLRLTKNLDNNIFKNEVHLHRLALSDAPRDVATFRVSNPCGGSNTLVRPGGDRFATEEHVEISTVDLFCEQSGIEIVDLIKIDTEGNDYNVLQGARKMFASGRIRIVQFEYNYRWIYARHFLRDAFEFLSDWKYQIGKVTPDGIEFYSGWHPELEKFVEGNYIACRENTKNCFPKITWWGDLVHILPANV